MLTSSFLLSLLYLGSVSSQEKTGVKTNEDSRLLLSPLIKAGKIPEAQEAARVKNFTEIESYSGFLTVNPLYNSNLFFWFFPSHTNPDTAPLLLWLQGGPGESSLFGLFTEHGPFRLEASQEITLRSTAWTLSHNVIYMDSPVGAGFSYTEDDKGFARTQEDVAQNLFEGLTQFFTLFPGYRTNDLYIAGESYGGKYVPAIARKIHQENLKIVNATDQFDKINLKGLIMGNAFSDPASTLDYGNNLYNLGIIDSTEKAHFQAEEEKVRQLIAAKQFLEAFELMDKLLLGTKEKSLPTYFSEVTGLQALYNLRWFVDPPELLYFKDFVVLPNVRQSIHVGNQSFQHFDLGGKVADHLEGEIFQSVKPWIEELLDSEAGYKFLFYTGQLDLAVGVPMNHNLIKSLQWKGAEDFEKTKKQIWWVEGDDETSVVAGYSKTFGPLTVVTVRDAGHRVPHDQPEWAFDMINRFTATGKLRFGPK